MTDTDNTRQGGQADIFSGGVVLRTLRATLSGVSMVSPHLAARLGLYIFLKPPRHRRPPQEVPALRAADVTDGWLGSRGFKVFRWGRSDRKVLICHSWGGRATQLFGLIDQLVASGFEVIGFDAPGHGLSDGGCTDMIEYSSVIGLMAAKQGPFHAVIGHSFGAGNVLYAKARFNFPAKKIVLIGCFSHGSWVIEQYGKLLRLSTAIVDRMKSMLEKKHCGQLKWDRLDIGKFADAVHDAQILIIHDKDDREIPHEHAESLHRVARRTRLLSTSGLGHRRIVRDKTVIGHVCTFLSDGGHP